MANLNYHTPYDAHPTASVPATSVQRACHVLAAVLCLMGFINLGKLFRASEGMDFYSFWVPGFAVRELQAHNIYTSPDRNRAAAVFVRRAQAADQSLFLKAALVWQYGLIPTSTPFLFTCFQLFRLPTYAANLWLYRLLSSAVYLAAIIWLMRRRGYSRAAIVLALAALTGWFGAFHAEIDVANVNMLQLGFLTLFLYLQDQSKSTPWLQCLSGLVMGAGLVFKPTIILVVYMLGLVWFIRRYWSDILFTTMGGVLGILASMLLASLYFGSWRCWLQWLEVTQLLIDYQLWPIESGNCAPAKILWHLYHWKVAPYIAAVTVTLTSVLVWRAWPRSTSTTDIPREQRFAENLLAMCAGIMLYLVSSHLVWEHYMCLTIPCLLVLFRPFSPLLNLYPHEPFVRTTLVAIAFICISTYVIAPVKRAYDLSTAVPVACSALILFALVLREIWRLRYRPVCPGLPV